jgi:Dyp-type peroxidase family
VIARRPPAIKLELEDIQGDILRAYGNAYDCTSYVFVTLGDGAQAARDWLGGLLGDVTTAAPWRLGKPATTCNLALTAGGLAALGVRDEVVQTFAPEFVDGMAARARLLGDTGLSDPRGWDEGLGTGAAHVLVTINAQEPEELDAALRALRAGIGAAAGVKIAAEQHAHLLHGAREHFGYADGFAQPAIIGSGEEKARGGGVPLADGGWRALAPGEFVLGYPDEDTIVDKQRRLPSAPVEPLGRNGTYMVWRKLHQDVALWRRVMRDAGERYPHGDEVKLAAKVIGRWPDGTPLSTHPDAPDPSFDPAAPGANDFRFGDDRFGMRCPLGAHIRRSNPRDALGFEGNQSFRHRMIRRGMPYGDPLPEGVLKDDGAQRGLCFVSFQASIARQFEGVQVPWLNDGNIFGAGHDTDFLLGDASGQARGKMTIQGPVPFFLTPQEAFVVTRGGEYLFVPGMRALEAIAGAMTG